MEETILEAEGALELVQAALDEANPQGIRASQPNPRSQLSSRLRHRPLRSLGRTGGE